MKCNAHRILLSFMTSLLTVIYLPYVALCANSKMFGCVMLSVCLCDSQTCWMSFCFVCICEALSKVQLTLFDTCFTCNMYFPDNTLWPMYFLSIPFSYGSALVHFVHWMHPFPPSFFTFLFTALLTSSSLTLYSPLRSPVRSCLLG